MKAHPVDIRNLSIIHAERLETAWDEKPITRSERRDRTEYQLENMGPLPREALILGTTAGGETVALNLWEPDLGPLLIVGDRGAGKTSFLQGIACGTNFFHPPGDVQYVVISKEPDEWQEFDSMQSCVGIFQDNEGKLPLFFRALYHWSLAEKAGSQSVLLLLDGLDSMVRAHPAIEGWLRWILKYGPSHRIWPIVTLETLAVADMGDWLDLFRTYIFAHTSIPNPGLCDRNKAPSLKTLKCGEEFMLCGGDTPLTFVSLSAGWIRV